MTNYHEIDELKEELEAWQPYLINVNFMTQQQEAHFQGDAAKAFMIRLVDLIKKIDKKPLNISSI